jgi:hypothetical protein
MYCSYSVLSVTLLLDQFLYWPVQDFCIFLMLFTFMFYKVALSAQTSNSFMQFSSSSFWFFWPLLMAHSRTKLVRNGDKEWVPQYLWKIKLTVAYNNYKHEINIFSYFPLNTCQQFVDRSFKYWNYAYHHHMALQPKSGPGIPCWGFVTITFLQGWIVSSAPNPQPGGPRLRIYDPRRQGGPAILPGTGYPS